MNCAYCGHGLAEHYKSGDVHSCHKEDSRMVPIKYRTGSVVCETRHCLQPLCCCVDFQELRKADER